MCSCAAKPYGQSFAFRLSFRVANPLNWDGPLSGGGPAVAIGKKWLGLLGRTLRIEPKRAVIQREISQSCVYLILFLASTSFRSAPGLPNRTRGGHITIASIAWPADDSCTRNVRLLSCTLGGVDRATSLSLWQTTRPESVRLEVCLI